VDSPATRADSGPGSVASFGPRFLAFVVDGLLADLLAVIADHGFHTSHQHSLYGLIAFFLIELLFVGGFGQTPGMRVVGIGVLRADRQARASFRWILLRTVLLLFVIPAIIADESGRAMHDRAAGTVMVHTR
jgi:uncharacterized RDD family membrane protein YckC